MCWVCTRGYAYTASAGEPAPIAIFKMEGRGDFRDGSLGGLGGLGASAPNEVCGRDSSFTCQRQKKKGRLRLRQLRDGASDGDIFRQAGN